MPYIPRAVRERSLGYPETPGELNYAITRLCLDYLAITAKGDAHYEDFNAVVGALECAKQELYRRVVAPYEDVKMAENGDVYR